ncbi:T9SS type A sorting domain-containing protein [Owenweeksia hongkongensis]|uniref:T9SS type A sorting domain-containing protein n=1 Tax=Owenweeksia hongkongensis TaxID=253245 RepID=UPI003A8D5885
MKKLTLLFIFMAMFTSVAWSQSKVFVGDTAGSSLHQYGPIYRSSSTSSYNHSMYGYIYEASDLLLPSGTAINKIAFKKATANTLTGGVCAVTIRMKNSSATTFGGQQTYATLTSSTYTTVYASVTDSFTSGADTWHEWTLSSPFVYTGGSLELSVDFARNGAPSDGRIEWYYESAVGKGVGMAAPAAPTNIAITSSSYDDNRPSTRFDVSYPAGTCFNPTGLNVSNITATSADASWTSGGAANSYVEYGPAGFTLGSGTTMYVSSTSAALTNLLASTDYDVYVKDSCAANSSFFIGPVSFSTPCALQLNGVFTIDGSMPTTGTNFQSFSDFESHIHNCGITGPVTINIASGTYTDQLHLKDIVGISSTNTITFNGSGSDSLIWDGTGEQGTIILENTPYVTLNNMYIANLASSEAWGILLMDKSDHVTITNCTVAMDSTSGVSDISAILVSSSYDNDQSEGADIDYVTIDNNTIIGGYYTMNFEGRSTGNPSRHYFITNNNIRKASNSSVRVDELEDFVFTGNTITTYVSSGSDGLYLQDINDYVIEDNIIKVSDYGLYLNDGNDGVSTTSNSRIVNNMILSTADDGLYMNDFENTDVFHNTVEGKPATRIRDQINLDLRNNIFVSYGNSAVYAQSGFDATDVVDYNVYYSTGTDVFDIGSSTYSTLAAWQTAEPTRNVNSLYGDPVFAASDDLHITGTLAQGAGDPTVGIITDIDGELRSSTTPDIGADESVAATCLDPINQIALNIQITSAEIRWSVASSVSLSTTIEYAVSGFTPGTGTTVNVAAPDTFIVLTNLQPNTTYDYYVKTNCTPATPSAGATAFSFTTLAPPCLVPTALGAYNISAVSADVYWTTGGASNWDIEYGVTGFTMGAGTPMSVLNDTVALSSLTAGTTYDFYVRDSCLVGNSSAWVGPFTFSTLAPCITPTALGATNITTTAADIYWTTGGASNWDIEYGVTGFTMGAGTPMSVLNDTVALSSLTAGTTYDFYVRDSCLVGHSSAWAGPFTFSTLAPCVAPTALGATNITTTAADIYWTTGGASNWDIEYGITGFTMGAGTPMSVLNDTLALSSLTAGTTYDFYVRDSCLVGHSSAWAGPFTFSTLAPCVAPTALGATNITTTDADIYWTTGGASNWDIEYGVTGFTMGAGTPMSVLNDTVALSSLTAGTTYDFYVRDSCLVGHSSAWAGPFTFTTLTPCADPTTLFATATCTDATLSWVSDAGATSTIQWGISGFTPSAGTNILNAVSPYNLTGLTEGVSYDFYVLDTCTNGLASAWVGPITFTTDSLPKIVISATMVSSGSLVNYDFDVTSGAAGTTSIDWDFGDGNTGTGANANHDYTANGTYTVVCVAANACGVDSATTVVTAQGIGMDELAFGNLNVFPNPSSGQLTVDGLNPNLSNLSINVVNTLGQVVLTPAVYAGQTNVNLDLEHLSNGVYHVMISANEGTYSVKVILQN